MTKPTTRWVAALASLGLWAAACGGRGSPVSTADTTASASSETTMMGGESTTTAPTTTTIGVPASSTSTAPEPQPLSRDVHTWGTRTIGATPEGIEIRLSPPPRTAIAPDEVLDVTITMTNRRSTPFTFEFAQFHDGAGLFRDGSYVGGTIQTATAAVEGKVTLAPGESREFPVQFNGLRYVDEPEPHGAYVPLAPGRYLLVGVVFVGERGGTENWASEDRYEITVTE